MTPFEKSSAATQLMSSEAFKLVLTDIRSELIEKLESCGIADRELQHEVTLMLQLLKSIPARLQRYVDDGKVEEHRNRQDAAIEHRRKEALSRVR